MLFLLKNTSFNKRGHKNTVFKSFPRCFDRVATFGEQIMKCRMSIIEVKMHHQGFPR